MFHDTQVIYVKPDGSLNVCKENLKVDMGLENVVKNMIMKKKRDFLNSLLTYQRRF